MKLQLILQILGKLLLSFSLFMAVPAVLAIAYKESGVLTGLILAVGITAATGAGMLAFGAGSGTGKIGIREGFLTVAGAWLLTGLFGALPYLLTGIIPGVLDALFESISGLTTTGASIIADVEVLPLSILLWRSMTHWIGGMGIIVLFLVFLPNMGMGAVNLYKAEVSGPHKAKVLPRIKDVAMVLWSIYLFLTVTQTLLLMLAGMPWFDAVNHSLSSTATGGFSIKNMSVAYYDNPAIEIILIFFMFICGGNFGLYFLVWQKGLHLLWRDTEFRVYALVIAGATVILMLSLWLQMGLTAGRSLLDALFQVVSIITSTGFMSADFDRWPPVTKLILLLLMVIGGCAGSTAGGIKIMRMILLTKEAAGTVLKAIHPRLVRSIVVNGKPVPFDVLTTTFHFFYLYMMIYAVSVLIVTACGMAPFDAIGAVASMLGNGGPGFGAVGPTSTYADVPSLAKLVFMADMLLGRLELFTFLVLLHPEFWQPYLSGRNWQTGK